MISENFLRPFIIGYTETSSGWKEHNHTIAVRKFMQAFKKNGYYLTPFIYPDGHGISNPITIVYKIINGKKINVSEIHWKRHPEIYEFIFGKVKNEFMYKNK